MLWQPLCFNPHLKDSNNVQWEIVQEGVFRHGPTREYQESGIYGIRGYAP
jgi:hypothetical protein